MEYIVDQLTTLKRKPLRVKSYPILAILQINSLALL